MAMVDVDSGSLYRWTQSKSSGLVLGRQLFYIHQLKRVNSRMALPWWQHHKHCLGIIIIIFFFFTPGSKDYYYYYYDTFVTFDAVCHVIMKTQRSDLQPVSFIHLSGHTGYVSQWWSSRDQALASRCLEAKFYGLWIYVFGLGLKVHTLALALALRAVLTIFSNTLKLVQDNSCSITSGRHSQTTWLRW